ncbi:MAG: PHP domain-containing protein [Ignavibacteriae bacterium]|nr:PHP domain-containing protein [Ignavibacteriota bacterium]
MNAEKLIKADVHLHTCLSPCAEITQSPKRVIEKAYEIGFNLVFITDHNSIANTEAAIKTGKNLGDLRIYPGMEITTREEIHILSLFENIDDANRTQDYINNYLPDVYFEKEKQEQIIANENDEVEGFYGKSLFSAVDLDLDEIIELIHKNNGIAIAAHIDRQSFSIISQLGFIPEKCKLDALEISPNMSLKDAKEIYKDYALKYKFVKGSDSHSLNTIGCSFTEYYGKDNSFESFYNFING